MKMRFRTPRDTETPGAAATEGDPAEQERVQDWQEERLSQLGYEPEIASRVVRAAWLDGNHADLVHRIDDLVQRGATLDQAARIVASVRTDFEEPVVQGGGRNAAP
ncbi:MAG TPA: hypothetical protein VJN72_14365 [Gaiellales bacterium]|nr:hypothetical protein [Gaiellales bacterium]